MRLAPFPCFEGDVDEPGRAYHLQDAPGQREELSLTVVLEDHLGSHEEREDGEELQSTTERWARPDDQERDKREGLVDPEADLLIPSEVIEDGSEVRGRIPRRPHHSHEGQGVDGDGYQDGLGQIFHEHGLLLKFGPNTHCLDLLLYT